MYVRIRTYHTLLAVGFVAVLGEARMSVFTAMYERVCIRRTYT